MLRLIVMKQNYGGAELGIHPTTTIHSFIAIDELETFLQHEERGGERIKPVIMGTQMPVHADLSDCCGFFMDLRDTGLYCNECGVEISVAWGQFYMQVKETMQAMWGGTKQGVHMNFNDCETGALEKWFSLGRMLGLFGDKGMKE